MSSLSIILPAYNNPNELELLLSSMVERCPEIRHHEVIVVDDASAGRSIGAVCDKFPFVKYVRCEKNMGVAGARNEGARAARNDILVFIDVDLIVQTDFIALLSRKFDDRAIVAVSGTSSDIPANPTPFTEYWGLYKAFNMPKGVYTTLFTGQQGAIRKDIFWKAGGWNSNIKGVASEEYEFTARLEKLGIKINYEEKFELQPHYKEFWKLSPGNYKRTKKWCILFLDRKKFDDYTSTFSGGMSYVLGSFVLITGILALVIPRTAIIFAACLLLYFLVTYKLWIFIFRRKGLFFTLQSVYFHVALSLSIFAGAVAGLSYYFRTQEARQKAVNG